VSSACVLSGERTARTCHDGRCRATNTAHIPLSAANGSVWRWSFFLGYTRTFCRSVWSPAASDPDSGGSGGQLYEAACRVREALRGRAALLVVDRTDIVDAAEADGVLLSPKGAEAGSHTLALCCEGATQGVPTRSCCLVALACALAPQASSTDDCCADVTCAGEGRRVH